jgi:hypothetical protein
MMYTSGTLIRLEMQVVLGPFLSPVFHNSQTPLSNTSMNQGVFVGITLSSVLMSKVQKNLKCSTTS